MGSLASAVHATGCRVLGESWHRVPTSALWAGAQHCSNEAMLGELMEDALAGCLSPALAGHLSPLAVSPVAVSRSASTDLVLHVCCHSAALGFLDFNAAGDAGSSGWTELDMLALSWVLSAG